LDPETLFYVTGGLAVGEFKFSSQTRVTTQLFGPGPTGTTPEGPPVTVVGPLRSESTTGAGLAVGAGAEKKFTRNWSGKLEYLYLDFGTHTFLSRTGVDTSVRLRDHIVRVGLNYSFGGPVVGR
jgi:outer membrane immunogenic protein